MKERPHDSILAWDSDNRPSTWNISWWVLDSGLTLVLSWYTIVTMRKAVSTLANFPRPSFDANTLNIFDVNHSIITIQQNSPFPKESYPSSSALFENLIITWLAYFALKASMFTFPATPHFFNNTATLNIPTFHFAFVELRKVSHTYRVKTLFIIVSPIHESAHASSQKIARARSIRTS